MKGAQLKSYHCVNPWTSVPKFGKRSHEEGGKCISINRYIVRVQYNGVYIPLFDSMLFYAII